MVFFGVWNAQQKSISDIAKQLSNDNKLKLEYYGFNSEEQKEFDIKNNKLIIKQRFYRTKNVIGSTY